MHTVSPYRDSQPHTLNTFPRVAQHCGLPHFSTSRFYLRLTIKTPTDRELSGELMTLVKKSLFAVPKWSVWCLSMSLTLAAACGDDDDNTVDEPPTQGDPDETPDDDDDNTDDDDDNTGDDFEPIERPSTYNFNSRFAPEESSVAYNGQVRRHLFIQQLKDYIGDLADTFADGTDADTITQGLSFYFEPDADTFDPAKFTIDIGVPTLQTSWDELNGYARLQDKFPDNEGEGEGLAFDYPIAGYPGDLLPEPALRDMFTRLGVIAARYVNDPANPPLDPLGNEIPNAYTSTSGVDYQQLIQKYLLGAVPLSQATDDYLDDDVEGKGLLSDNTDPGDSFYTPLEHVWDEGFGYFGAARNYGDLTDDQIADGELNDPDEDELVDLYTEYNFGASVNAAKRDNGSEDPQTDYTQDAFEAFLDGRTLIVNANGELSDEELEQLQAYRDQAVGAWEKAIAATVVHYINDVLGAMSVYGTDDYSFADHAKYWSEMKGFALGLQFNKNHSPFVDEAHEGKLTTVLNQMGNQPVFGLYDREDEAAEGNAYAAELISIRDTFGEVYEFSEENLLNW